MISRYLICLILLCQSQSLASSDIHAIYITVIDVNHDDSTILIKSFSDDLVSAIKADDKNVALDIDLCSNLELVQAYINAHLSITVNDKELDLTILDCAIASDTHRIRLSYKSDETISKLELKTTWFTDLFLNQQNIVKLYLGDSKQHVRLNGENTTHVFKF